MKHVKTQHDMAEDLDDLISKTRNWIEYNNDYLYNTVSVIVVIWILVAIVLYVIASLVLKSSSSSSTAVSESKNENEENKSKNDENGRVDISKSGEINSKIPSPVSASEISEEGPPDKSTSIGVSPVENGLKSEEDIQNTVKSNGNTGRFSVKKPFIPPKSIGSDLESVQWVNQCLEKICESPSIQTALTQIWLDALTQYTKSLGIEDITYINYEALMNLAKDEQIINFNNLVTQSHPGDNMTVSMDVDIKDVSLKADFCQESAQEYTPIIIKLKKLKGRCAVTVFSRERLCNAKLEGWPEIQLEIISNSERSKISHEMVEVTKELTISSLRGSQVNVNLEDFEGSSHKTHPFPVFYRKAPLINLLANAASQPDASKENNNVPFPTLRKKAKRFLHVCVAKAVNLTTEVQLSGTSTSTLSLDNCYVSLELDEPCQKFRTDPIPYSLNQDTVAWNQTFTFELTNKSKEILFEVWNESHSKELFLGLGIVSTEELQLSQSQRMIIPLQGNPAFRPAGSLEEESFGGLLTLQFLLTNMDHNAKITDQGAKIPSSPTEVVANGNNTNLTNMVRPNTTTTEENQKNPVNQSEINLNYLEELRKKNTSALLSRMDVQPDQNGIENPHEVPVRSRGRAKRDFFKFKNRLSKSSSAHSMSGDRRSTVSDAYSEAVSLAPSEPIPESKSEKRKSKLEKVNNGLRNFLTELRSISADRLRSASQSRGFDPTQIPGFNGESGSGISDISAASGMTGLSGASDKTYIAEESSLVLECREKNQIKHYLIPYHIAKSGKFGKSGTKLHIYMDHVFVAQHVKSGTHCQVCQMNIPLRLGKQGYKCRDCSLICHKPCHIRVESHCLETSMPQMELLFLPAK